jgi:hypothetical protein
MSGINMHFSHNNDDNDEQFRVCPPTPPPPDMDVDIELLSSNPLYFDGRFNINEFLRILHNKVDKVHGKDLSSNDFTDFYKNELDNLDNIITEEIESLIGIVTYREIFVAALNQTTFTLQHTPGTNKEVVNLNGLEVYPGVNYDYTLSGNIITFNYPLDGIICYKRL